MLSAEILQRNFGVQLRISKFSHPYAVQYETLCGDSHILDSFHVSFRMAPNKWKTSVNNDMSVEGSLDVI